MSFHIPVIMKILQNLKSLKISLTQCDIFFYLKYLYVMFFFFSVCVTGIRIQTTNAGSIKRMYTI